MGENGPRGWVGISGLGFRASFGVLPWVNDPLMMAMMLLFVLLLMIQIHNKEYTIIPMV